MKKRLAVLALVFGLTSISTAAVTWSRDTVNIIVGGTASVQIYSSTATYPGGTVFLGSESIVIAEITGFTPAGYLEGLTWPPENSPYQRYAGGWWSLSDTGILPPLDCPAPYLQWEVSISGNSLGSHVLQLDVDGSAGPTDYLTVNVVPEPATIALLAFGGLFLRRRK